jgi:hypothetical protein
MNKTIHTIRTNQKLHKLFEQARESFFEKNDHETAKRLLSEAIDLYESNVAKMDSDLAYEIEGFYKTLLQTLGNIYFDEEKFEDGEKLLHNALGIGEIAVVPGVDDGGFTVGKLCDHAGGAVFPGRGRCFKADVCTVDQDHLALFVGAVHGPAEIGHFLHFRHVPLVIVMGDGAGASRQQDRRKCGKQALFHGCSFFVGYRLLMVPS